MDKQVDENLHFPTLNIISYCVENYTLYIIYTPIAYFLDIKLYNWVSKAIS